jgi:cell division septal protein FtsQ
MPSVLEAEVDLDRKTMTLNIDIVERKQEYVWCLSAQAGKTQDEDANEECYYMDKDGLVFVPAPEFEGHVFVTFTGLVSPEEPIGKSFLAQADMENLLGFMGKLQSMGLTVASVSASTTRDVRVGLRSGTELIVSLEKPLDTVAKSVDTLMRSPDFKEASGGIESISYIDLRYGSKAFWK